MSILQRKFEVYTDVFFRLDAVEDLMNHETFENDFQELVRGMPDLERIVSRIHAGTCKIKDFLKSLNVSSMADALVLSFYN
jgi:DNA mismatch repair ATPase MutS